MAAPAQIRSAVSRVPAFSHDAVIHHLLRRGFITDADAMNGALTIKNVSRRNHVYSITREAGDSHLLKQGVGPDRISTIQREALIYEWLARNSGAFAAYLPRCYGYDPAEHVLLVQFVKDGEDLRSYCTKRRRLPARILAELGRALAMLHRANCSTGVRVSRRTGKLGKYPWVLSLMRPDVKTLWTSSGGTLELLRLLQGFSEFGRHFARLRRSWTVECLIHADLRWDNCIIIPRANASNGDTGLKIVDWELARRGDPRWDVGAVFSNCLGFWLSSIPITGDCPPDRYLEAAEMPLEKLQPAIRAFWESYKREAGLSERASARWLLRAVEYAAAQLVQTAFEHVYEAAQLPGVVICFMQLCLNMFRQPRKAAEELLGLTA